MPKHRQVVLLLFEFPSRYVNAGPVAAGSIDGAAWMTSDRVGETGDPVPSGSALFVRGWATNLAGTGPATAVVLVVDGSEKFHARLGVPRPDVARDRGNDAFAFCGFEGVVTTGRFAAGTHELVAYSVDADGRRYAQLPVRTSFSVVADWVTLPTGPTPAAEGSDGSLDELLDESRGVRLVLNDGEVTVPRGSMLALRGWFHDPKLPAEGVKAYALVDGQRAFAAAYGSLRHDVAEKVGVSNVGFEAHVPTASLAPGIHEICIVATPVADDGGVVRTPVAVRILVGDTLPVRVALEEMASAFIDDIVRIQPGAPRDLGAPLRLARGDRLFLRGWAVDEIAGSPGAGVVFVIDRRIDIPALYGLSRADVAAERKSETFLPTGFTAEITTDELAAGHHAVACYVLSKDGRGALATAQTFDFEVSDL